MFSAAIDLYKKSYEGLSKRIWLLSFVMLINRSGTMVLAFMTLYCTHLGYSIKEGGLVVAIYGVGSVFGAFFGGRISDRFGFYYTQFGSLFFGGILFIVLGYMQSYLAICICTFLLSMVNESFRPANATAITHYSEPKSRTQSFSLIRLAINLGWGIGGALAGIFASIDYHLLFWVDGCTNIASAFALLWLLPRVSLQQQKAEHKHEQVQEKNLSPYRDKKFLMFLVWQVLFAMCFFQLFTTVPIYFKKSLHLSEFWIGLIFAGNGVLIALVEMVLVYKLEGRRPYLFYMVAGTLMMGVSYLFLNATFLGGLIVGLSFMLLITIAEMIAMPFMNSFYISRTTQYNRGAYAGLYTMAWSVAQVIGSSAGSLAADQWGFTVFWIIVAIFCTIAAWGYYRLSQ